MSPGARHTTSPVTSSGSQSTKTLTNADGSDVTDAGILNDRAIDLPKPIYPAEAKKVHAAGQVQVKVFVDETGKVISAEAMFGPESLRAAAVEAAKRARFKPSVEDGVAKKFFGVITYDFVAP